MALLPSSRWLLLPLLAAALSVAPDAWAASDEPPASAEAIDRAKALNASAVAAYLAGRFTDAVAQLREAIRFAPSEPILHLNVGKAYEALRDRREAVAAYERYLALAPAAKERVVLEARIVSMRRELTEVAEREERRLAEERARMEAERRAKETPAKASVSPWPFVVVGVGAAGLGAGVISGVLATGKHDDAVASPVGIDARQKQDSAESLALGANVALAVGGALLAAGVAWVWLDARARSRDTASIGVGPGGVLLRKGF